MPTIPIVPANDSPAPLAVVASNITEAKLIAAYAEWDGTGASGDFLPCLAIYTQAGVRLGRVFPSSPVTAGDQAVVTYAPFPGGLIQKAAPGSGLQFDTEPQAGDWLDWETTGQDGNGYGQTIRNSFGTQIVTDENAAANNISALELYQDITSTHFASALFAEAVNSGAGNVVAADIAANAANGDVTGLILGALGRAGNANNSLGLQIQSSTDSGAATGAQVVATVNSGAADATALELRAFVVPPGAGNPIAIFVSAGLVNLNLPTAPGPTGTLYSNLGIVTVSP